MTGLTQLEATAIQIMLAGTGESPCGITFAFPPTDRSGPGRLFWRRVAGLDGRRPERQTCQLELLAEHEGETPA